MARDAKSRPVGGVAADLPGAGPKPGGGRARYGGRGGGRFSPWLAYAVALVSVGAALLLRHTLGGVFEERPLLILFVLPVILSAHLGGLGPGLVATIAAALSVDYFALPPRGSFAIASATDLVQWIMFLVSGVLISVLTQALHRAHALAEKGYLLQKVTLASIGDAVVTADAQGMVSFVNGAAERLTGWSDEEGRGRPLAEVAPMLDEATHRPILRPAGGDAGALARMTRLDGDFLLLHRHGGKTPVAVTVSPITQDDGQVQGVVLTLRDRTAQRQAEGALNERVKLQERLAKIAAAAPGVIFTLRMGPDGSVSMPYASGHLEEICGLRQSDLAEDAAVFFSVMHPQDVHRVRGDLEESAAKLCPWQGKFRVLSPRRGEVWLEPHGVAEREADGGVLWHGFLADVTKRVQAQAALSENQATLGRFFDSAPFLMGVVELDGDTITTLHANLAMAALYGLTPEMFVGRTADALGAPPQLQALWARRYRQSQEEGAPVRFEFERATAAGKRWLAATVSFIGVGDNGLPRFCNITEDITERRLAGRALRESEERYRLISEHSGDVIWLYDLRQERFVYVSPSLRRLRGLEPEEIMGRTLAEALSPEAFPEARERLSQRVTALEAGDESARVSVQELEQRHKDGSLVPTEVVTSLVQDRQGKVVSIIGVSRDIGARRQAEERVRWLAQFPAQNPNPVLRLDARGELLYCNQAGQQMLSDLPGNEPATGLTAAPALWRELAAKAAGQGAGLRHQHAQGDRIFGLAFTPVGAGEVNIYAMDVTDLWRAERRLHMALLAAKAGVWEWDLRTNENFWSEELWQLYGLEQGSAQPSYQLWLETIHPADRERAGLTVREAAENQAEINAEWRTLDIDGQQRWLMSRGQPLRDAGGQVVRYLGVVMDVTERKRAEETLRQSEGRFRQVVEAAPEGIFIQTERRFAYLNPAAVAILGATEERELLGQPVLNWVHPDYRNGALERIRLLNEQRKETPLVETRFMRCDGRDVEVEIMGVPFLYQGQSGALVFIRDIGGRKSMEREKRKLENELIQAQKMEALGTLAGGIAHDFNNILGAISGYAELARDITREGGDNAQEIAQVMAASERAGKLVRQILTFSRKAEAARSPMNLNTAVEQTLRMLKSALPKMIAIETRLADDLCTIDADHTQMEQMVMNLATNAADAMSGGGTLLVETRWEKVQAQQCLTCGKTFSGDFVVLKVSDTGQGIDEATRQRIFEPFFTTKGLGRGTGLGLATVYGVVKGHGGHIQCQSRVGEGTTFTIFMPCQNLPTQASTSGEDSAAEPAGGRETILLVDDEEPLRLLGERSLGNAGYQVLTAASGEAALETFRAMAGKIDLVVLDLSMPGMGGQKCLAEILALDQGARVVIASGYAGDSQIRLALETGAVGYVAKPFRRAELLTAVRKALEGPPACT